MISAKPKVRIVATGGSIAGIGPNRLDSLLYAELGQKLSIQELLARIPETDTIAEVLGEDAVTVSSTAIGPSEWLFLARRINTLFANEPDLSGVVVTHGTATLEETAYFLHLTVKSSKPVVITGAMRPPTALGTDADRNLMDAIRVAASPASVGKGVLTVLNNQIHSARDVTKTNSFRLETFKPNELGFLGYVDYDDQVLFYRSPTRDHTISTEFSIDDYESLPRVDMVYSYAGSDGLLIDAVRQNGTKGLVIVGYGGGSLSPTVTNATVQAIEDGISVVLATRSNSGRVIMTPKKEEQGFIVCDNLLPQKARILLMLALTRTNDRSEIQNMFYRH